MKKRQKLQAKPRITSLSLGDCSLWRRWRSLHPAARKPRRRNRRRLWCRSWKWTKKNVARSTTFIGQLDSPQNVEVRARVESFVEKILFEEGTEVQAGAPLFELDKKPYEERLAAAKGGLAQAKAALSKSTIEVPRLTALAAQKAVPQKDLDTAVATKEANEANVASAEARVKSAELDLGYCDVKAPISGAHRREGRFRSAPSSEKASLRCSQPSRRSIRFGFTVRSVKWIFSKRIAWPGKQDGKWASCLCT